MLPSSQLRWVIVQTLIAATLGGCSHPSGDERQHYSPGHRLLVEAFRGEYPPEAQLTGDLAVGVKPVHRSSSADQLKLLKAAQAAINRDVARSPEARTLAAAGVLHLLLRRHEVAVHTLQRATLEPGCPPEVWSDLAAALIVRAGVTGDAYDLVKALAPTQRALASTPDMPQALFNRLKILERLELRGAADQVRHRFLADCVTGAWCEAARLDGHRDRPTNPPALTVEATLKRAIEQPLRDYELSGVVAAAPQAARVFLEESLVVEALGGISDEKGVAKVRLAAAIGRQLFEISGDRLPAAEAACLATASVQARGPLARGGRLFAGALADYQRFDIEQAEPKFARAEQSLAEGECPLSLWARFYRNVCRYYVKDLAGAQSGFTELEDLADRLGYLTLAGRAGWMRGLTAARRGDTPEAVRHYRRALARFERAREEGNQGALHSLLAGAAAALGDERGKWDQRLLALRLLNRYGDRNRLEIVLSSTASDLAEQGDWISAIDVQDEVIALLDHAATSTDRADAFWHRASLRLHAGDPQGARADIYLARSHLPGIDSAAVAEQLRALIDLTDASLERRQSPARALVLLDRVVAYAQRNLPSLLVEALLERARTKRALGRIDAAATDLERAIANIETRRARTSGEAERMGVFSQGRELFEELVAIEWDERGAPLAALRVADRGKARSLLDQLATDNSASSSPLPGAALLGSSPALAAIAPQTRIVVFSLLPNRTLAWVGGPFGWRGIELQLGRSEVEALTARLVASIAANDGKHAERVVKRLSDVVVAPLLPNLVGARRLVISPDGALGLVPFAALHDADGHPLIDSFEVVSVPSLAALSQRRSAESTTAGPATTSALVVAAPRFDRSRYTWLAELPGAEDEAKEVAGVYGRATLLLGSEATPAAVARQAPHADVLHFGTHAVVDEKHPERSRLVLGEERGYGGDLHPREIAALGLQRCRLVVLAACSTSAGGEVPLEGVMNLARPFLAAGARAVVTSLWAVDDQTARIFFADFHRRFVLSGDAVSALRESQLRMLADRSLRREGLAAWAGFQVVALTAGDEKGAGS